MHLSDYAPFPGIYYLTRLIATPIRQLRKETTNTYVEKTAFARHMILWGGWNEFIDDMIAEDDRIMVHWTFRGVQEGEYLGILPKTIELLSWLKDAD